MLESFLFLFTGIVGAVTITLMITSFKSNPFYNIFLLIIISIISIRFLIHGSYVIGLQSMIKPDKGPLSIFYLIVVPCFYLYNKHLVLEEKTHTFKFLKHLIFIVFLYVINVNTTIKESFIFYYGNATNFVLISLFLILYLSLLFNLLSEKIWFKKDLQINDKHFSLFKNWTVYLFLINLLIATNLLISIYYEVYSGQTLSGKSMAFISLLFWLFIYFKILISPEILYGLPILNEKLLKFKNSETDNEIPSTPLGITDHWILETKTQKSDQDLKLQEKIESNIRSYIKEVDRLSYENNIFRSPKTSASDIAKELGLPASHIVYLFKYHSSLTFSEYRMLSRIQDSINLIHDGYLNRNTLESLALKIGFASYNPFFVAFKKITSLSPQDFLKTKLEII